MNTSIILVVQNIKVVNLLSICFFPIFQGFIRYELLELGQIVVNLEDWSDFKPGQITGANFFPRLMLWLRNFFTIFESNGA